ncbi:MAG: response regulator transcription factor [Acidobacteria bacterium]|nr:response regulator transcription factor [Acidobacteriota bacterium]
MRALIVDDEPAARQRLATLLEELGVTIEGEAPDGLTALTLARERTPDVILLDVAMPEVDGFDVARHLAHPRPLIIFQTAYAQFALKAFEHEALDYVLKPVTRERLALALDRAQRRLDAFTPRSTLPSDTWSHLGAAFGHAPARPERLLVRHGSGHQLMPVASIERFSADERLVYAVVAGTRYGTDYTLNELEPRFGGAFVRASRSELVNLLHVSGISSNGDGSATLALSSGAGVHVSRRRAAAIRTVLER